MTSKITQLLCNNFGGIRRIKAIFSNKLITASNAQNVELYATGLNDGVGIRTMKGNTAVCDLLPLGEKLINLFESVQGGVIYTFVHAVSETQGKIYLFDALKNTLILKRKGLSVTSISCGCDVMQGWSDLFVFSNGEQLLSIEIGAINDNKELAEVKDMNLVDMDGRTIKGFGLYVHDSRLWVFDGNVLWYSVQNNIYDFSTSDAEVATSAGYIEFVKNITAIYPYLGTLAVFFKDSSVQISGTYPYSQGEECAGGCAGYDALVFHNTELYFYDNTKKGIFNFSQVVLGNKTLGDNIAEEIQEELLSIDENKIKEIKAVSYVSTDRNEIWWLLPITDDSYSIVMIYDYIRKEWLKRKCQKIHCLRVIDNVLYSGSASGKILQEYNSNTFDGEYIQHFYNCSPLNLGAVNTLKILYFPPRVSFDLPFVNTFYVKYIKNFDVFKKPKIKLIKAKFKNFLIWGVGRWGINYWASKDTNTIGKFPNATFKTLEIQIYTENKSQNFAIKNIEFSKIKVKQV